MPQVNAIIKMKGPITKFQALRKKGSNIEALIFNRVHSCARNCNSCCGYHDGWILRGIVVAPVISGVILVTSSARKSKSALAPLPGRTGQSAKIMSENLWLHSCVCNHDFYYWVALRDIWANHYHLAVLHTSMHISEQTPFLAIKIIFV